MPLPVPFLPGLALPVSLTPRPSGAPPPLTPSSGSVDWGAFLRRRVAEVALAPISPLAPGLLDRVVPPDTDPATGLPINPAVTDARALGMLMDRLGMGAGWKESTAFLDRDPTRAHDPVARLGDSLGLLGALMGTSGREIAQPAAGSISRTRAALPGFEEMLPFGAGAIVRAADPNPGAALARYRAAHEGRDPIHDRDALRGLWAESSPDEQAIGARFIVEMMLDPTNYIFTRSFANALGTAGSRIGGSVAKDAAGEGLEQIARILNMTQDAQDDLFSSAFKTLYNKDVPASDTVHRGFIQAIPWINELSPAGKLSEFSTMLGDFIGQVRRSRVPGSGADTDPLIDLALPDPTKALDEVDLPSISRVTGQRTRDELAKSLQAQADTLNAATAADVAAQRKARADALKAITDKDARRAFNDANPRPEAPDKINVLGMIDKQMNDVSAAMATKLRSLSGPEALPAVADAASEGAAHLERVAGRLEQWEMYLATQVKNKAMSADDAAKDLVTRRLDALNETLDIHKAVDDAIERARAFNKNRAGQPGMAQLAADFHQQLADIAEQIDDFPRTLAQTREEIMGIMLGQPRSGNVWRYHPIVEAFNAGTSPVPFNRLYSAATSGAENALDEASLKFALLTAGSKARIVSFARANGYDQPLNGTEDFKKFIADIQASRIPDERFLGQQVEDTQMRRAQALLDVYAARQQSGQDVLDTLAAGGKGAEDVRNYLLTRLQGDLAERLLGRDADAGTLTGGRFEAFVPPQMAEWFRNQGSAFHFDRFLNQLVGDRSRMVNLIRRGNETAGQGMTDEQIIEMLRRPKEALQWTRDLMGADDANQLRGIYEKWRRNPFPRQEDEADAVWDLIADRLRRSKATDLGIKDNRVMRSLMSMFGFDQVLQEEALAQPGTLLTNLGGGTLLAALHGSDPVKILRNAVTNARLIAPAMNPRLSPVARREALSKIRYNPSSLEDIYEGVGMEVPGSLTQQTKGAIAAQTGRTRGMETATATRGLGEKEFETAIETVHPIARAVWGGVEGANIGSAGGVPGMAAGALLGALYRVKADPEIKVVTNAFYNAVEGALRGTRVVEAWDMAEPYLAAKLEAILKEHLGGDAMPMMGHQVSEAQQALTKGVSFEEWLEMAERVPMKPEGNPLEAIREAMQDGPMISADEVRRIAFQHGLSAQDAAEAGKSWAAVLKEVSDGAITYSNKTNFDYLKTTNLEEFLRNFVWFPTWPVRFAPLFAEMIAEHPSYLWSIQKFNDMSERVNKQADRPAGMAGYLGGAGVGTLLSNTLWGRAGYLGLNLSRAVAGQVEALGDLDEGVGSTPQEKALNVVKNFGLGLKPQLQIPLEILGIASESPFEVMRSNPMKAAIAHAALEGINAFTPDWIGDVPTNVGTAEAPLFEARHMLRRALSPVTGAKTSEPSITGSETKDQMIRRRIVELAYEDNGERPQGPYQQALSNPGASREAQQVWEYARRDVEHVIATQTILNNTLPARARYISQTEQELRAKSNRAWEERQAIRSELTQRQAAGQLTPKEAADIERRENELVRRANPLADALYNVSGGSIDTEQRATAEYRTFTNSIRHLPAITQRIMIRKFLAERPDLARALERYQPGAAQQHYIGVQERSR